MKKSIAFAFLIVLSLCILLSGCGEKSGAEYVFGAMDTTVFAYKDFKGMRFLATDSDTVRLGVSVNDLTAVDSEYADEVPDIKDADIDVYFDFAGKKAVQSISGECDGESFSLALYESADSVVAESSELDGAYSIETVKLLDGMGLSEEKLNYYLGQYTSGLNASGEFFTAIAKYKDILKNSFDKYVDFDIKKSGKNVTVTFTLTNDEVSKIIGDLAEAVNSDEELCDILSLFGSDAKTVAEAMKAINSDDICISVKLVMDKDNYTLYSAEITSDNTVADYIYDKESNNFTLTVNYAEIDYKTVIKGETGSKNEYTYSFETFYRGESMISYGLEITAATITLKSGVAEVEFMYLIDNDTLRLGLLELRNGAGKIDYSDMGICFTLEKNVTLPTAPSATKLDRSGDFVVKVTSAFDSLSKIFE